MLSAVLGTLGFSALAGLLVAAMVTPAIAVTGATVNSTIGIFDSLPEFIEIGQQPEQNKIFAKRGDEWEQIAVIFDQNREEVSWNEVSQYVKDAAISGEDRRFMDHGGVDFAGVVRAAIKNAVGGGIQEGASTITQQLVKNLTIQEALKIEDEAKRDAAVEAAQALKFDRKLKEMKLAIALEKQYTKQDILLGYLNIAGFGGNTYGIQAAAERYYNTSAKDLTIAQAASLMAIVQETTNNGLDDPAKYPANKARRDVILHAMFAEDKITQSELDEALATPVDETTVTLTDPKNGCMAAEKFSKFFCDYVVANVKNLEALGVDAAERKANWKRGGYQLYTTLDLDQQKKVQNRIWDVVPTNAKQLKLGSATDSIEVGTGRILVMAQNKKYDNTLDGGGADTTAVNFSTDKEYGGSSGFQTGSTYKLFTLLNWMQNGHGLNEVVNGSKFTYDQGDFTDSCASHAGAPPWKFQNSGGGGGGTRTVFSATVNSVNSAFVAMAMKLDLCEIRDTAKSVGVHRADGAELQTNPSSVLGTNEIAPLTMAAAFATIAGGGTYCKPIAVDYVVAADGTELPGEAQDCYKALDSDVAATAAYALQGVMTQGTGTASNPRDGTPVFGKTGTTDNTDQTWIVGGSTEVVTAVWVGNIEGHAQTRYYSANGYQGNLMRHGILNSALRSINKEYGGKGFTKPSGELLDGNGVRLPNLVGDSFESARNQLEVAGFTVKDGGEVSSSVEEGRVAKTSPGAGALVSRGTEITVFRSNGEEEEVPDVVGDGETYDLGTAVGILAAAGFTDITQGCEEVDAGSPSIGRVVATDPEPGDSFDPDEEIEIYIGAETCD